MQHEIFKTVKAGQIIYIEDINGDSWPFGITNILTREFVDCQALGRKTTPLATDERQLVTIILPVENGAHIADAHIEESDDSRSRLILKPTGEVKFVQRRQYFRVNKPAVACHYQILERGKAEHDELPVEGMVWDLSGSGIGIIIKSPRTIYSGSEIKLKIELPQENPIEVVGEVVRAFPRSVLRNEYFLGVNFVKIKERDRDKIIKYITQEQLALINPKKVNKRA